MSVAEQFFSLFSGYQNAHGTHGVPTLKLGSVKYEIKSSAKTIMEPPTIQMMESHLNGTRPLGLVPIRKDNTCLYGSIDIDDYDINPLEVIERLERSSFPLVPCRSKSGGLHLFIFFAAPEPASDVMNVLKEIAANLGFANAEIFPKQSQILSERGDCGSWIILPYFGSTYDGKIKEQVGLKKTGSEMTVQEFINSAFKSKCRIDDIKIPRPKPVKHVGNGKLPVEPFADGPPCLQHLAAIGVAAGGQSNTLMQMGIYYKKADPENWVARLEEASTLFLRPPSSSEGLSTVIQSLRKTDYQYLCKQEPLASHCNSKLCRARKHGVGDGSAVPIITGMSKLDADPPIWFLDVEDVRLECSTDELMVYFQFRKKCAEQLNKFYAPIADKDWSAVLSSASENLTLVPAAPDVSEKVRFLELLEEFLTNRSRGERWEDILSGRPYEDIEEKRHYFQLRNLQSFLKREDYKESNRGRVTQRIKALGGDHCGKNIKGSFRNLWWVPTYAVSGVPEVSPPSIKGDVI